MHFWFPDGQMGEWACLGAVTDRSVRLWLRSPDGESRVARLAVEGRPAVEMEVRPLPGHDHIAATDLTLPEPAPGSPFTVEVGGMVRQGSFAPAAGQATSFAFAFGSCHEPFVPGPSGGPPLVVHPRAGIYAQMRRALQERGVGFLLLLGDQIYSDSAPWISVREHLLRARQQPEWEDLREVYRELYRGYFHQSGFRELLEGWPSYMMWDDHDIYDGYGSLLASETTPYDDTLFQAADVTFREYQHLHNPRSSLDGGRPYHYHFWYGDSGFFVFDLRSDRDYRAGSLLGPQQRADFHAFLQEADEREAWTVFIGATIPIVHFSPALARLTEWVPGGEGRGVRDRWTVNGFRPVRDEVLEALFAWQVARPRRQAIVLSGDVHAGASFRLTRRGSPGVIQQWTSSPFTTGTGPLLIFANWLGAALINWGEREFRAEQQALVPSKGNFGMVEVQPLPAGGHEVAFTIFAYNTASRQLQVAARQVTRPSD